MSRGDKNLVAVAMVAVAFALCFGWATNTFDNFLWRVGLNHSECAMNGYGAMFCGEDLKIYQARLDEAGIK